MAAAAAEDRPAPEAPENRPPPPAITVTTQNAQQELQKTVGHVQQGATQVVDGIASFPSQVQHEIRSSLRMAQRALTDFRGRVKPGEAEFLQQCYVWATTCLIGFFLGEVAGKQALHGLFKGVFGGWTMVAMLGIVVPVAVWGARRVLVANSGSPQLVLAASVTLGVLLGSIMHGYRLQNLLAPPPAILPLTMAAGSYIAGRSPIILDSRGLFVALMLAPGLFVYVVMGMHQMCSSYMFYVGALMLAALIDVQVKLDTYLTTVEAEQWRTVVLLGLTDQLVFWMLATNVQ